MTQSTLLPEHTENPKGSDNECIYYVSSEAGVCVGGVMVIFFYKLKLWLFILLFVSPHYLAAVSIELHAEREPLPLGAHPAQPGTRHLQRRHTKPLGSQTGWERQSRSPQVSPGAHRLHTHVPQAASKGRKGMEPPTPPISLIFLPEEHLPPLLVRENSRSASAVSIKEKNENKTIGHQQVMSSSFLATPHLKEQDLSSKLEIHAKS